MNPTSNMDWTSRLNIATVCVSFSFILAIVVGVI
jgi:hypothetical protein